MIGINTGLRTLLAYRLALDTAANNIANANTPGYSRQRVLFTPVADVLSGGINIGQGAQADSIERITNEFLLKRIRVANRSAGRLELANQRLAETESLFRSTSGTGINQLLGGFFNSLRGLTTTPADVTARNATLESARDLASGFNLLSNRLSRIQGDAGRELETLVEEVNQVLTSLHSVNSQIVAQESTGSSANNLRDQQDQLLNELSNYIDADVIDREQGRIDILVGGRLVLSRRGPSSLEARLSPGDTPRVFLRGTETEVNVTDGKLRALLDFAGGSGSLDLGRELDTLAFNTIFEINRQHSTGIGLNGGFSTLSSEFLTQDLNGNGDAADELLGSAGLAFPVTKGELYVNLVEESTGKLTRTRISIDPDTQTLRDLSATLNAIPNLSASADSKGRLTITAAAGFRFDFSPRVEASPDSLGAFGGTRASISSNDAFPIALTSGDSFAIAVDGNAPQTVTLQPADFADLNAATAEELATVINRDVGGVSATVQGGRLVIQSDTDGSLGSLQITDSTGTPATALGFSASLETGSAEGVSVTTSGSFSGSESDNYRFEAVGTGIIGETEGLKVQVLNQKGEVVTILDVGKDYEPGDQLTVEQGLTVSFSQGTISEDTNDSFALDLIADSDTSDVLAALGINALFAGSDAGTLALSTSVNDHPERLSASLSGAEGDSGNVFRMIALEDLAIESQSGQSFGSFFTSLATQLGFESRRVGQNLATQTSVLEILEGERDQISGVSLEEESINIIQYQQTFDSMIRYMQAVEQTTSSLIALIG